MTEYRVFGTGREKGCEGGDITHLSVETPDGSKTWPDSKIIEMIEKDNGDTFWSYVYKNGKIINHTRVEVEDIDDKVKGRYLRTQADTTEENNLLELPIYHYDKEKKMWVPC